MRNPFRYFNSSPEVTLQRFTAIHSSVYNHLYQDRHLNRRDIFKENRSAALAEWRQLCAA